MSEWYFNPVGGYWVTSAVALALVLLLTLAGLPRYRLTSTQRAILFALRLAVIALAVLAMLRPALVHTTAKKHSSTIVMLVDQSRSMLIADGVGGKTRWELLRRAIADSQSVLGEMAEEFELKAYTFDSELHPQEIDSGKIDLPAAPTGVQTAIGAALDDLLRREIGKRIAGVILLSDGAQRAYAPRDLAPQGPTRRLADLGYPLYALPVGQPRGPGQARDVALRDLSVNQSVYVKNDLTVHANCRIEGYAGETVPVQLLLENPAGKMEVVSTVEVRPRQDGEAVPIEMHCIPQTPGEYKLAVKAAARPGELVTTNNELDTFISVLTGGVNVLYIEGALRVDSKYLLLSLDASSDIKVDYVRLDPRDPKQRPTDLPERFQRGKYDVYVIGDVDSSSFSRDELQALATVVQEGAGLVLLGGFHAFGPGGYAETPLAAVLPILLDPRERQRPNDPPRADVHLQGPLKIRPARPLGEQHYLMDISSREPRATAWDRLPPLEGANRFGAIKPSGRALAESTDGKPLLVVQEAGGRVLAFAGDSTWHWWMEGFQAQHQRFWRQVILWAARKDEVPDGNVWVHLATRRFAPRDRVEFTCGARSPQGEPLPSARATAEAILPDGSRQKINLVRQGDHFAGAFDATQTPGDYAISFTAEDTRLPSTNTKARLLVYEQDLELDNATADPSLLASLAAMTKQAGGKSVPPEELSSLLEAIRNQPVETQVEAIVKQTPWDTWPFFLLFLGLISSEWYLRKRWGLV